jgi:hypothetical protein
VSIIFSLSNATDITVSIFAGVLGSIDSSTAIEEEVVEVDSS